jgi:hypothetical protein
MKFHESPPYPPSAVEANSYWFIGIGSGGNHAATFSATDDTRKREEARLRSWSSFTTKQLLDSIVFGCGDHRIVLASNKLTVPVEIAIIKGICQNSIDV